jgi:hypothetical protein
MMTKVRWTLVIRAPSSVKKRVLSEPNSAEIRDLWAGLAWHGPVLGSYERNVTITESGR